MFSDTDRTPNHSQYIAALDLGSNSFHMVIAKQSHGEIRILETFGEKVRLAAGIDNQGKINESAEKRALDCLARFRQRIRQFEASRVMIVGTNALRVAKNRRAFIEKAEELIGFPIEVISGREEARLIYLGVAHSMSDDKGKRLVIDIGGGSTEFIIGQRFEPLLLESLHMGCVSYRDRYVSPESFTREGFDRAVMNASRELLVIKKRYTDLGWNSCVGSSGSIKAIWTALQVSGISKTGEMTPENLKALRNKALGLGRASLLSSIGVKEDRVPTFMAGFAILYGAFKALGIRQMQFNPGALREGLIYDVVGRVEHEDVRERTIRSVQERYHIDTEHCDRVEKTALHAYQQVADEWGIKEKQHRNLVVWASRVFELGYTISHTQHHKHGAYLIQHSDLPGFTDQVKLKLATIVRLHRRKFNHACFGEFNKKSAQILERLCIIFRLAVILTANRISKETEFKLAVKNNTLSLTMGSDWISEHPLTMASLETEQKNLEALGFTLEIK